MGLFDDIANVATAGLGKDKKSRTFFGLQSPGEAKDTLHGKKEAPKPLTAAEKKEGKLRYEELSGQYNRKTGTYKVGDKQVKSSYTPEQGGYYRDRPQGYGTDKKQSDIDKRSIYGIEQHAAAVEKSRRIPRKRVSPSLVGKRQSTRRQKALAFGRSGTVLTNTLGGTSSDRKRKTLLS